MVLFSPYRSILKVPGTALFAAAGLIGRLHISMVGLGIVLLVEAAEGSYGLAGAVSAVYMLANAAVAVTQGRLLDRFGQGRVLRVFGIAFGVFLGLLITSVREDWPLWTTFVLAAVAGGSVPQVSAAVRARWSHVLADPRQVQTAFALEAVLDEVVFIIGPMLVTVLATSISPTVGLTTALTTAVVGSLLFSSLRATEPPAHQRHDTEGNRVPMPWRPVIALGVVAASQGVLFGAAEVTTVAFADERGHVGVAGVLLAAWALGSMLAGLVAGAMHWRASNATRVRWGALAMGLVMVPLMLVDSIWLLGLVLLVAGVTIAPTMIAVFATVEETVPRTRMGEGMAVLQTGLVIGVAPGASIAGVVIDRHGASPAYAVCVVAGVVAALAAQFLPSHTRLATRPDVTIGT